MKHTVIQSIVNREEIRLSFSSYEEDMELIIQFFIEFGHCEKEIALSLYQCLKYKDSKIDPLKYMDLMVDIEDNTVVLIKNTNQLYKYPYDLRSTIAEKDG